MAFRSVVSLVSPFHLFNFLNTFIAILVSFMTLMHGLDAFYDFKVSVSERKA